MTHASYQGMTLPLPFGITIPGKLMMVSEGVWQGSREKERQQQIPDLAIYYIKQSS